MNALLYISIVRVCRRGARIWFLHFDIVCFCENIPRYMNIPVYILHTHVLASPFIYMYSLPWLISTRVCAWSCRYSCSCQVLIRACRDCLPLPYILMPYASWSFYMAGSCFLLLYKYSRLMNYYSHILMNSPFFLMKPYFLLTSISAHSCEFHEYFSVCIYCPSSLCISRTYFFEEYTMVPIFLHIPSWLR